MKVTKKKVEKTVTHPMEEFFDLEPNTTISTHVERETEMSEAVEYDEKDKEIEKQFQEIYDKALTLVDQLQDEVEDAEVKYVSRLMEVSSTLLNTALNAAARKAKTKEHKDKLVGKTNSPQTVNNTIIMNREDLLKRILSEPIEVDVEQIVTVEQIMEDKDDTE